MKMKKDYDQKDSSDPLGNQLKENRAYGPLQEVVFSNSDSWVKRYRNLVCGDTSNIFLLKFELITGFFGGLPGAIGFGFRKFLYKYILGDIGHNVIFGRNISLAHSPNIRIGNNCLIADNCELNASGEGGELLLEIMSPSGAVSLSEPKGEKLS